MTQSDIETVRTLVIEHLADSYAELAIKAGWFLSDGSPNKMKVWRVYQHMTTRAKPKRKRRSLARRYGVLNLRYHFKKAR